MRKKTQLVRNPFSRSKKTPQQPPVDLRPFLPGGEEEQAYRRLNADSKAKRDFLLGDYLIDGRPVPDFIPDRAKVAVERSMMMTLRNGGLARREQAAAEALRRLRAAKKRLNMLQRGRPSGPSLEENTEQFVRKVKDAILAITAQGRRVTLSTVAEQMGRVERTLRRHFNDFGFSSWAALKRACQP